MKNIIKILSFATLFAVAVSCDINQTPRFDDCNESFAAFDVTSITVNEDVGTISIPVTIASVRPKAVAVAYSSTDGTATAGVNYEFTDASAVLQFNGTDRTMNVVIDIKNLAGQYTGDLSFTVSIISAGELKLGANTTCTIKITDLDHPLASILGTYTAVGGYYTGTPCSWPVTLEKDPDDVSVVWIDYMVNLSYLARSWGGWAVYGNVSEDLKTITIPCGQTPGSNSAEPAWNDDLDDVFTLGTWEDKGGGSVSLSTSGSITMTLNDEGVWVTEDAPAMWTPSGSYLAAQGVMTKGTLTWTKN